MQHVSGRYLSFLVATCAKWLNLARDSFTYLKQERDEGRGGDMVNGVSNDKTKQGDGSLRFYRMFEKVSRLSSRNGSSCRTCSKLDSAAAKSLNEYCASATCVHKCEQQRRCVIGTVIHS